MQNITLVFLGPLERVAQASHQNYVDGTRAWQYFILKTLKLLLWSLLLPGAEMLSKPPWVSRWEARVGLSLNCKRHPQTYHIITFKILEAPSQRYSFVFSEMDILSRNVYHIENILLLLLLLHWFGLEMIELQAMMVFGIAANIRGRLLD